VQVLELWEDASPEAAKRPPDERHYVRLIYNKQPSGVHGSVPDEAMTLAEFRRRVMEPYAIAHDHYVVTCAFEHDSSVPHVDTSSY
jgi:hypothetical protein